VGGLTVTVATGTEGISVTVMWETPLFPSLVAVIVAEPGVFPVATPLTSTLATAGLSLVQATGRSGRGASVESCGVAVSCTVCPTGTVAVGGVTSTVATRAPGVDCST